MLTGPIKAVSGRTLFVTSSHHCTLLITVIAAGAVPEAKGEPETAVSAPVFESIVNTETVLSPLFVTRRNLPGPSTARADGFVPAGKGEPASGDAVPVEGSIEYAETLFEPEFAT
jgi:hypothetical protein